MTFYLTSHGPQLSPTPFRREELNILEMSLFHFLPLLLLDARISPSGINKCFYVLITYLNVSSFLPLL